MKYKKEIYRKSSGVNPAQYKYRGFIINSYYECGRNHWTGSNIPNDNTKPIRFGGWENTIKDVQKKIDNYLDNTENKNNDTDNN